MLALPQTLLLPPWYPLDTSFSHCHLQCHLPHILPYNDLCSLPLDHPTDTPCFPKDAPWIMVPSSGTPTPALAPSSGIQNNTSAPSPWTPHTSTNSFPMDTHRDTNRIPQSQIPLTPPDLTGAPSEHGLQTPGRAVPAVPGGMCLYLSRCARVCWNIWDRGQAPQEVPQDPR